MHALLSYFYNDYRFKLNALWFKRGLYGYVIIKCAYWLMYFPFLFGSNSLIYPSPVTLSPLKNFAFIASNAQWPQLNLTLIILALGICLAQLFYRQFYLVADFLLWLAVLNLHNVIYPALSGGDYLANQFLLFNCFLVRSFIEKETGFSANLKVLLHNVFSVAIILQVCLAYFLAALSKLSSHNWLNGGAIGTINKIRHFSLFHFPGQGLSWLWIAAGYFILAYQLTFSVLVWVRPIQKPFLLAGMLIHLYIAFVMGLPGFALIMIIGYTYFWPFKKAGS